MINSIVNHVTKHIELSESEIEEFCGLLEEVTAQKKTLLIQPNDIVTKEYYVVNGCLKAYYLDESGNKHILQFAIEDWWISDFEAFFKGEPANLYIEAIEDSVLLSINKNVLDELYLRIPKFERFFRLKTEGAFVSLRARILDSLQKTNKERYLKFCELYPQIEKRVTNYHIANYLGIKPESLSRIRKEINRS